MALQPGRIPPEVEMKGLSINNKGRMSLSGPGRISSASLAEYRAKRRLQELIFDLAGALTRDYVRQAKCEAPAQVLFPQMMAIVQRYVKEKVYAEPPSDKKDLFLAPYYGNKWGSVRDCRKKIIWRARCGPVCATRANVAMSLGRMRAALDLS